MEPADRLLAELSLTGADVGLSDDDLSDRIALWMTAAQAALPTGTSEQQYQAVKAYALRAWIAALIRKADSTQIGGLKTSRDILGRVEQLKSVLARAELAAGLPPSDPALIGYPAPVFQDWTTDCWPWVPDA